MDPFTQADAETKSVDVLAENVELLSELFPEVVSDGTVDFEALRQLLGDAVDDSDERFGLNWHGKRRARQFALTPSTGTLRPCPDESVDWDTTQNLMIEGDNLEVLKLLQKSYAGKVKLIYIDPPYNTGKDFVYPDNFKDSIGNYLAVTGQTDDEGQKLTSNTEASGRFHTDWLNMMYPRLKLARSLLRDDGVIIVSIDDTEVANLRRIADEVFGDENALATLVWDRNRKNDAKFFSVGHEYMLVWAKSKAALTEAKTTFREPKPGIDEARSFFDSLCAKHGEDWAAIEKAWRDRYRSIPDSDPRKPLGRFVRVSGPRGPFRDDGNISWPGGGGPTYEVLHPKTGKPCKVPDGGWRYPTHARFSEEVASGRVVFGPDETTLPRQRRFLFESQGQVMPSVNYSYAQSASADFVSLMGARVFENPKYWVDLRRLVGYLSCDRDLVMDFFAGSGTTGQAVMEQNAIDDGARRYVLVQLPEPLDPTNKDQKLAAGYCDELGVPNTIAELTKERLRRAGAKVAEEHPEHQGDAGFRVFKLDSSNIRAWDPYPTDLDATLEQAAEHLKPDRSEQDVLYEILLKLGLDLCVPIQATSISGLDVHAIGGGVLVACLDDKLPGAQLEALAAGIAEWVTELEPAGDTTCVFRDSAFADDVAKTNLTTTLAQAGIATVRSI